MTDRELLERAARAAGLTIMWSEPYKRYERFVLEKYAGPWNPLVDDGDAFRLAVKMRMLVDMEDRSVNGLYFEDGEDRNAAVRRAIVRAAGNREEDQLGIIF